MSDKFTSTPASLWDEAADEYEEVSYEKKDGAYPANSFRSRILLDFFETAPRGSVLDAGCGTGQMTRELLRRGWEVTSVDYSENMLRVAEQKTKEVGLGGKFVQCSLDNLKSLGKRFDYIMLNGVLPYIATEEEPAVFEQLRDVATDNAILLSAHYNVFFNMFMLDRWTAETLKRDLLKNSGLSAAQIAETANGVLSVLREPIAELDKERTMKMENPLSYSDKLEKFGFEQLDLAYYNFFYLPAKLKEHQDQEAREAMEETMRRSPNALLFARGFVSIAKRDVKLPKS